jgi:hypothetical protein
MRNAVDERGAPVKAGPQAPAQARCPVCGGTCMLRTRRRSGRPGDVSYFWRHADNAHLDCPNRPSAARAMRA